jgi:hypothetical protein
MKFTQLASTFAITIVVTALPSFAQVPAPALVNVIRYHVKRDHIPEFEEIQKQIAGAYKKAASDRYRVIYREEYGDTAGYWVLTPMSGFADRDVQNPYVKMSTEPERAARAARLAQYLESVQTSIERYVGDLSVTSPGIPFPPTFFRYLRIRVRPGTTEQLIANLKTDVLPALKKMNGVPVSVRQVVYGGNTDEFTVATGFQKWADLDDTLGAETFRKFEEKMQGIETNVEEYIVNYEPALSYYPAATPAIGSR